MPAVAPTGALFPEDGLRVHVDYANGNDVNDGLGPSRAFQTIQAAYDALVSRSGASYTAGANGMGVGIIECAPGNHDVGAGFTTDDSRPVYIRGSRAGFGKYNAGDSSTTIVSSSSAVTSLFQVGTLSSPIVYGNRFEGLSFYVVPETNTSLLDCIRTYSNDYLEVYDCSFVTSGTTLDTYAITNEVATVSKDSSWHRIRNNVVNRMGFIDVLTGSNHNRSIISENKVFYSGNVPMIRFSGQWRAGTVMNNNFEGTSTAVWAGSSGCFANLYLNNSGESTGTTNPFYDMTVFHKDSLFIGGRCTIGVSENGTWVSFSNQCFGNIVIGGYSVAGINGLKGKYVDNTTEKDNVLISRTGYHPKIISGAGRTVLEDNDFDGVLHDTVVEDSTWGFVRNSSDSKVYLSARINGAWFKVEMT